MSDEVDPDLQSHDGTQADLSDEEDFTLISNPEYLAQLATIDVALHPLVFIKGTTKLLLHAIPEVQTIFPGPPAAKLQPLYESALRALSGIEGHLYRVLVIDEKDSEGHYKPSEHLKGEIESLKKKYSFPWLNAIDTKGGKAWMTMLCRIALFVRADAGTEGEPDYDFMVRWEVPGEAKEGLEAYLRMCVFDLSGHRDLEGIIEKADKLNAGMRAEFDNLNKALPARFTE